MGSTRFFKVAKAKSEEGLVVVKVFVRHDPTLPLEYHKERLEYIKKSLANAVNCLPFQRVEVCINLPLTNNWYDLLDVFNIIFVLIS